MSLHDRLKIFIKSENLSISAFEAKMGFSNGSLSKALEEKRAIGSDRIETIFSKYPDLSAEWLFRNIGEMKTKNEINHTSLEDLRKTIAALEKVVYYNELVSDELRAKLARSRNKDKTLEKKR